MNRADPLSMDAYALTGGTRLWFSRYCVRRRKSVPV